VKPGLGRKRLLAALIPRTEPNRDFLARLSEKIEDLGAIAENPAR
jgi:hypothetical protein